MLERVIMYWLRFESVKEPYQFIKPVNGVIGYFEADKTYRWYTKKAIFAVSDKFDI